MAMALPRMGVLEVDEDLGMATAEWFSLSFSHSKWGRKIQ
jgi:hypothetical protein